VLIKNKHIKCVSSCVTERLDRNTSYFKRQAGKHATLCQPKTETSPSIDVMLIIIINIIFVYIYFFSSFGSLLLFPPNFPPSAMFIDVFDICHVFVCILHVIFTIKNYNIGFGAFRQTPPIYEKILF
jgi:hypothetical protein